MENNDTKGAVNPSYDNPLNPNKNEAPPDPSNTSHIGQKVEQGVISKKEGISEQSAEWEDAQESNGAPDSIISNEAEKYIKDPSPEEVNHDEEEK